MEDDQIIEQFLNRNQAALDQARGQYGDACRTVAERILGDDWATEAAVQEALRRAWDTIPPKQPKNLKTYLLRLTRNAALEQAPQNSEYPRVLGELGRCISPRTDGSPPHPSIKALRRALNEFLDGLAPAKRRIFVLRYWYLCSVEEISNRCGVSPDRVRTTLKQVRGQLRELLKNQKVYDLSAVQLLRILGNIRDQWILEAMEAKRALPMWLMGAAVGVVVCCAVTLGTLLVSRQAPPEETQPPQTSAEASVTFAPIVSTTEGSLSTTESAVETSVGSQTEPSIQNSAVYQKLQSLYNADQFDPGVLEAFAQWIEGEEGFMETYSEGWHLEKFNTGVISLVCYTPLTEDSKRTVYSLDYIEGVVSLAVEPYECGFTSIPREEIAAKVYGAEDSIGVDDELKEAFIDFILFSDWFPWSTLSPEYERTEWYFVKEPLGSTAEDQTEYIQLFVKVWKSGDAEDENTLCSLWYNGTEIRDGRNG